MDADVAEVFVLDDSDESDNDSEEMVLEQGFEEFLTEEGDEDDDEEEEEDEATAEDNDVQDKLSCKKCGKKYHLEAWLKKHEDKCEGNNKTDQQRKKKSTPILNGDIGKLISDLNYDCYFETTGLSTLNNFLEEITRTTENLITLRGERFANAVQLSRSFSHALKGSFEEDIKDRVQSLMKSIGEEVWLCIFGGDVFNRSDCKWGYSAQHMHHLRNDQEVK